MQNIVRPFWWHLICTSFWLFLCTLICYQPQIPEMRTGSSPFIHEEWCFLCGKRPFDEFHHTETPQLQHQHPFSGWSGVTGVVSGDLFPSWWFQPIWKILVKTGSLPQVGVKIKNIWNHHLVSVALQVLSMVPKNPTFDAFGRNNHHGTIMKTTGSRFFQHEYCTLPDTDSSHLPGCAIPRGNNRRLSTIHLKVRKCWLVSGRGIYLHHPSPTCRINWWFGIIHFFAVYLAHHSWTPKKGAKRSWGCKIHTHEEIWPNNWNVWHPVLKMGCERIHSYWRFSTIFHFHHFFF